LLVIPYLISLRILKKKFMKLLKAGSLKTMLRERPTISDINCPQNNSLYTYIILLFKEKDNKEIQTSIVMLVYLRGTNLEE
jgi:hypothetical protein